ncbi:MAG: TlpA family protein disulfide reductase, partial [Desulfobacca sp.]|nr:TlpA family protein disulfide reductase [Desulfobacca sp.]
MVLKGRIQGTFRIIGLAFIVWALFPNPAWDGNLPTMGSTLPPLLWEPPAAREESKYLGISHGEKFSLAQVNSRFVLIEIIGVYCPVCHTQAPLFNQLFRRIQKDVALAKKVKMLAIAVGATPMEVSYLKKEFRISFPIIKDPTFTNHKILGEPKTP